MQPGSVITPAMVWVISRVGTASFFVDRYLLPCVLGLAVLLTDTLTQIFAPGPSAKPGISCFAEARDGAPDSPT